MKKNPFWMLLTLFLLHVGVYAQQQEIGLSATPNFTAEKKTEIYSGDQSALNLSFKNVANVNNNNQSPKTASYAKAIYFEFLGSGLLYSINYDMRLKRGKNDGFGARIGIGKGAYFPPESNLDGRFSTLPLNINYIYGPKRSGLEAGLSLTPHFTFKDVPDKLQLPVVLNFGYRYQPIKKGLVFRLAYTPIIGKGEIDTWVGASIGYSFK